MPVIGFPELNPYVLGAIVAVSELPDGLLISI